VRNFQTPVATQNSDHMFNGANVVRTSKVRTTVTNVGYLMFAAESWDGQTHAARI